MRAETLTLIQALLLFALAIHLGGLVIYVLKDPNEQKAFSSYALYAFAGGINLGDLSVPAAHRLLTTYIDYHKGHHRLRDRGYNVFTAS